MISWAKITQAGNSAAQWFRQQVTYRGKVSQSAIIYPYGYHANAKVGSLMIMFGVNGDAENRAGIPWDPQERPDLLEGEVALYKPGSNTTIILKNDDTVVITTPTAVVDGDLQVTGDTTMTGKLTVQSAVTFNNTVSNSGTNIGKTHAHSGVQSGGAISGPPT